MEIPLVEFEKSSMEGDSYDETIARYYADFIAHAKSITKPSHCKDPRILKALEHIEKHFKESISLQMVADHVGLSGTVLSKMIKNSVGYTYVNIVIEIRIAHAMEMIYTSNESLTSIAFHSGFNNPRSFTRLFRQLVGLRPMDFKKTGGYRIFPAVMHETPPYYILQATGNQPAGNEGLHYQLVSSEEFELLMQRGVDRSLLMPRSFITNTETIHY